MKQTHSFLQGSPEWAEHRRKYLNASDASAAMGLSRFKTRSELMRDMATGITVEHDDATLARFAKGHEFEAIARPWAEEIIGGDLFPVVMSDEIDGLPLSASFDGIDMAEEFTFEHKTANAALLAALEAGDIPAEYKPQMEQGLMISGATRCLFMASAGDKDAMRYAWYESDPDVRAALLAAWEQFSIDLANFQYIESAPAAVAAPIRELPALQVEITGAVTASNLIQWKEIVTERIAGINTDLQTDQDFADADSMVKFLDEGEKRIDLVKSQAQANASEIDQVFRALDEIKASMRAKRLELDKLVTKRKNSIKIEIMQAGKDQLAEHIAGLNKRLGKVQMPAVAADFATAIKGKRNLESMRGAVADLVAAKKIESNEIADKIDANLDRYADIAAGHEFLFRDLSGLLLKDADAFEAIVLQRINQHAESERKRLEAEREKIRIEEERKAAAKVKAEQEEAERKRIAAEREANAKARQAAMPKVTETIDHGDGIKTIVVQEPAAQAPLGVSEGTATPVAAAPTHKGMTGSARLLDRLDDLARQMTEQELSDLCIHAAHILENRKQAA